MLAGNVARLPARHHDLAAIPVTDVGYEAQGVNSADRFERKFRPRRGSQQRVIVATHGIRPAIEQQVERLDRTGDVSELYLVQPAPRPGVHIRTQFGDHLLQGDTQRAVQCFCLRFGDAAGRVTQPNRVTRVVQHIQQAHAGATLVETEIAQAGDVNADVGIGVVTQMAGKDRAQRVQLADVVDAGRDAVGADLVIPGTQQVQHRGLAAVSGLDLEQMFHETACVGAGHIALIAGELGRGKGVLCL